MLAMFFSFFLKKGAGYVYGITSRVSHVGNLRYNCTTETELVVLLLMWYFLGGRRLRKSLLWASSLSDLPFG